MIGSSWKKFSISFIHSVTATMRDKETAVGSWLPLKMTCGAMLCRWQCECSISVVSGSWGEKQTRPTLPTEVTASSLNSLSQQKDRRQGRNNSLGVLLLQT